MILNFGQPLTSSVRFKINLLIIIILSRERGVLGVVLFIVDSDSVFATGLLKYNLCHSKSLNDYIMVFRYNFVSTALSDKGTLERSKHKT